jgi:hypothetical protein
VHLIYGPTNQSKSNRNPKKLKDQAPGTAQQALNFTPSSIVSDGTKPYSSSNK